MRIHVTFTDRVGITQEVLALLGARNLNLDAVEMVPPNVYIDAPELRQEVLHELHGALLRVRGVLSVQIVDMLPGQRRSLHLDALLAAMGDPVLAVDAQARVLLANPRLIDLCGRQPAGESLSTLFDEPGLAEHLMEKGFRLPMHEVSLGGQPLLLDATPIRGTGDALDGGLMTLYPPSRIGERLSLLHHDHAEGLQGLIGRSAPLMQLKARVRKVAGLDAPLLIQGETGTGKELVARACHALSARREEPFLALNCAALPESLAESELFGYASGAFTGAQRGGKPGLLELADRGTVFLDEVGEMSPYLQAKLLRFLSDGCFRRIGGEREVRVNVRVLCATHRNLAKMVGEGSFREDLYYRLNGLVLQLPALREREDRPQLLAQLLAEESRGRSIVLDEDVRQVLLDHPWPGNVRQLRNVLRTLVALSEGGRVHLADLPVDIRRAAQPKPAPEAEAPADCLLDAERGALLAVLEAQRWHMSRTAQQLGISRNTLYRKLRRHGLSRSVP